MGKNTKSEKPAYRLIAEHYESCLETHGDNNLGVGWPRMNDVQLRHRVMLEVIRSKGPVELLDFGCGLSHLWEYICEAGLKNIRYSGVDISEKFIQKSAEKFPDNSYFCLDVLKEPEKLPTTDYIVANGVFTQKCNLSYDEMWHFFSETIVTLFQKSKKGIAFNVMSKQVDWEKDGAFHVSFNDLSELLTKRLSRYFHFRHDYGLYEYTTYVYKEPI